MCSQPINLQLQSFYPPHIPHFSIHPKPNQSSNARHSPPRNRPQLLPRPPHRHNLHPPRRRGLRHPLRRRLVRFPILEILLRSQRQRLPLLLRRTPSLPHLRLRSRAHRYRNRPQRRPNPLLLHLPLPKPALHHHHPLPQRRRARTRKRRRRNLPLHPQSQSTPNIQQPLRVPETYSRRPLPLHPPLHPPRSTRFPLPHAPQRPHPRKRHPTPPHPRQELAAASNAPHTTPSPAPGHRSERDAWPQEWRHCHSRG